MKETRGCKKEDLANVDILTGLHTDEVEELCKLCLFKSCSSGEYLGHVNEPTDELLIVQSGKVAIEMRIQVPPYNQKVTISTLTKGQVCAWSALVEPHVLTSSIKCIEPSEIIAIKASDLQHLFKANPRVELVIMRNLTKVIASRLRDSRRQFMNLVADMIKQGN